MHKRALAVTLGLTASAAIACGSSTDTKPPSKILNLTASMVPGNEPSVSGNPSGSGTFTATLDTSTNVLTYSGTFTGLTGNATLGHIHGPFPNGAATSAGVILNFDPSISPGTNVTFVGLKAAPNGTFSGTVTLNAGTTISTTVNGDSLKKLLLAGLTYVNIHTSQNPAGEVRGQITVKPAP